MVRYLVLISFLVISLGCSQDGLLEQNYSADASQLEKDNDVIFDDEIAEKIAEERLWIKFPWTGYGNYKAWNQYTYNAIGGGLTGALPNDIKTFCPNYKNLNSDARKMFWIGLVSAISKYESNFNPSVSYKEAMSDTYESPVVSRGLLQISYGSSKNYGCGAGSPKALHDSGLNLRCGVKIISHWIKKDDVISSHGGGWKGAARYWAVLRTKKGSIASLTRNLSVCK